MPNDEKSTATRNLTLNSEEATELLQLLEGALGETRVEVHHTHTPGFRDQVQHREVILRGLIEKLRRSGT